MSINSRGFIATTGSFLIFVTLSRIPAWLEYDPVGNYWMLPRHYEEDEYTRCVGDSVEVLIESFRVIEGQQHAIGWWYDCEYLWDS